MTPLPALPTQGLLTRDGAPYFAHADLVAATNVALALRRPLLLTGEPGCGKTELAWAAARALHAAGHASEPAPREAHVRSDSRAQDLLYHYDALARFSDAHHGEDEGKVRARDARNYIELQALGQGLVDPRLSVVLIDEIDKAPRDLPNDLLRELDHGRFSIPEIPRRAPEHESGLRRDLGRALGDPSRPLVIITSNVERQLPDAFLRRCVFYHIRFPDREDLRRILQSRFPADRLPRPGLLDAALRLFGRLRAFAGLSKPPATSELIDWVGALAVVYPSDEAARRVAVLADAETPAWSTLPGLSTLIKLREDLSRLEAAQG